MNRRDFLGRVSLIAAGAVAADQLELIERLGWKRKLFPGWSRPGELWVHLIDQQGAIVGRAPCVDGVARFPILGGSPPGPLRFAYEHRTVTVTRPIYASLTA